MMRRLAVLALAAILTPHEVMAQVLEPPPPPSSTSASSGLTTALRGLDLMPQDSTRACDGCPPRRLGTAFLQVTYINIMYELANLIRGQVTARITPATWWTNVKRGWEWDLDDFVVNQIGHPYQGNNYFTAGRANGLDFWESSALTAFGSGTWEYFGETNQASLNDFINTTLGGIALGEMFHRAAWLVRDTRTTESRKKREIIAAVIDPMTGLNRFISGDASRVSEKPPQLVPSSLNAITSVGYLGRGSNTDATDFSSFGFLEVDLLYGDLTTGRSRTPYDAFAVRLDFGGGSAISEARVRGRLIGQPFKDEAVQVTVSQGYQFNKNNAYQFGAQSVDVNVGFVKRFSSRTSLWALGWGGLTILGAVDSMPLPDPNAPPPEEEEEEDAGQGVSTGPRFYDYGPGTTAGGFLRINRDDHPLFALSYELYHLHVLDGVRADHLLQRLRTDLRVPLKGRLGVGVSGEFFDRRTFYQQPGVATANFHFPQFRTYLTWSAR